MSEKINSKHTYKTKGVLSSFLWWPFFAGIVLLLVNFGIYFVDKAAAGILLIFAVIYWIICIMITTYIRPKIMRELMEFASNYSQVQRRLIYELSVPYCLLDSAGTIMWMNKAMEEIIDKKELNKPISTIIPSINPSVFPDTDEVNEIDTYYKDKDYRVEMKLINADELIKDVQIIDKVEDTSKMIGLYMFDETELVNCMIKLDEEKFVVGLVYIDNYEEVVENVDDARRSLLIGLVDKRVNKYFAPGAAIVRKLEKDKYLIVFKYKFLEKIMEDKFSLLEEIKSVKVGNEMSLTISAGFGTGAEDYSKNNEIARMAIDLALGRGGDQAVLKSGDKVLYYGGKSQQMEKNTRVKVRVKAHALRQIIDSHDNILVMGHKLADIDAFGSALGIYIMAKKLGKEAHIVIEDINSSIRPFVNKFIGKEEYPEDMLLSRDDAPNYITKATALIVVDVNIPTMTECPTLLDKIKDIVVFDHHRQSNNPITNAILSYVDPYASSASEMVTEMIQYVDEQIKLKAFEADALYAGMYIDTDGFHNKSGPRTFEAAAFLRRNGADVTRVRKMLRTDMAEYKAIAEAVSRAEVYKDAFAITQFNGLDIESPTVGGAKAANQLLDISGIKASFVFTDYNNKIFISARSIDEVNVQLVMEKLGGGGHMTIAGAQLTEKTVPEAMQLIKETLDGMIEEGEI